MKRPLLKLGLLSALVTLSWPTHPDAAAQTETRPLPQAQPSPTAAPALRADQTLAMTAPYTPDPKLPDDYRCFVLGQPLERAQMLSGYQIQPGTPNVVHHALLFVAVPDQLASVRALDGQDGRPGWPCFGGPGLRAAPTLSQRAAALKVLLGGPIDSSLLDQATNMGGALGIGSWTPGSGATIFPEGTGRLLPKGSLLVMQVHYNTLLATVPDRTSLSLQFAANGDHRRALTGIIAFAPVELPCPAGQSGAGQSGAGCLRDEAVKINTRKYGQRAGFIPAALLRLCHKTPADYSAQVASQVTSTCDLPVRRDATAYGVTLHLHTRGLRTSLVLNPDMPAEQTLLDIPAWDFHWQGSYWYQQPIALHAGDRLRISCTWDNSGPNARYIVWGEGTQDEMCLGALSVTEP